MKIVCLDYATLGNADMRAFEALGELQCFDLTNPDQVVERLQGADVAMVNKVVLDEAVLDQTNLKLILETATGTNNIAVEYAQKKGIVVKNVAGYSTQSVAQHTFALLFGLLNAIAYYDRFTKNGKWCQSPIFTDFSRATHTLHDKKWGIIGLGAIGREVAKIARAFGAQVFYFSTSGKNQNADFARLDLDELLKTCDVVSIHAPLNDKTRHLIGESELRKMKDGAVLINVGRGGIVDEDALAKVLDEKSIRVALDVLETEPMRADHPLLKIRNPENLIITPHIAFASQSAMQKLMEMLLDNLKTWIATGK